LHSRQPRRRGFAQCHLGIAQRVHFGLDIGFTPRLRQYRRSERGAPYGDCLGLRCYFLAEPRQRRRLGWSYTRNPDGRALPPRPPCAIATEPRRVKVRVVSQTLLSVMEPLLRIPFYIQQTGDDTDLPSRRRRGRGGSRVLRAAAPR